MHSDNQELERLVRESGEGNTESFRALYDLLVNQVYRFVRSRTSTDESAIDLTQDIFIALHKALRGFTYRSRAEFFAYVFRIVKRALARHYGDRHTKSLQTRADVDGDQISDDMNDSGIKTDLEKALSTLDPITEEIVTLHYWGGYSFSEIGAMLDMEETAARVRNHRGMKQLKEYFNQKT